MIKAHEIQGVIALENSFNRVGLDHVVLVKVASTAVVAQHARPLARRGHQRGVARVGRRPEPAHLPPRAEHRLAQELGRRRRDVARRAPRADREDRRDGLPVGADREDLGLLRRAVQGQRVQVPAPVRQLRDGERAVQDQLPRGVPRADRRRVRDAAPSAASRTASTTSRRSRSARTSRRSGSSTRRARSTIPPTATTASSTWSPCR